MLPPLGKLGVQLLDWEEKYLPEHLWLADLIRDRSVSYAAAVFNAACDVIDEYFETNEPGHVFLGYISDFRFIPEGRRDELLLALLKQGPAACFSADFRRAMGLYPIGPAHWLAESPDPDKSMTFMRELVRLLQGQKVGKAAQCRILPFNRILKHELIFFTPNVVDEELSNGLTRYPNVEEDMRQRVEQFVRIAMDMSLQWRPRTGWATGFWASNLKGITCQ